MIENVTGDGVGLLILDPNTHAYDILNHWSWECRWVLSSASKYGRVVCVHFSPVPSLFYRCSPSLPLTPLSYPVYISKKCGSLQRGPVALVFYKQLDASHAF